MLFRKRTPTTTAPSKSELALAARERDHEALVRRVHAERERGEAERVRARIEADAEAIRQSCQTIGHWWPGMPAAPESRFSGRPTLRERLAEMLMSAWRA
jgi:hypothetical protein